MTDEERAQPLTRGDFADLIAVVVSADKSVQTLTGKFRRQTWLMALVILSLIGLGYVVHEQRSESACVASLAAASADRTGALLPLSNAKNQASDDRADAQAYLLLQAISSVSLTPAQRVQAIAPDVEVFKTAAQNYSEANQAYKDALKAHPAPATTEYHC